MHKTPLDELTAFYTLLERMEMRVKMNLPPISISWLRHCGKFESHQKLPFWSEMPQNRWRLELRLRPRWGSSPRSTHCWREWRWGERSICLQSQFLDWATVVNLNCTKSFYTLLERMEMRGKMNLPPISISWLRYCSSLNLNRTKSFLFDLKCPKIVGGWGSTPGPAGELTALPRSPGWDGLRVWNLWIYWVAGAAWLCPRPYWKEII